MAALKKADIKRPMPRREAVTVAALGGDVVVRGLTLSERLALFDGLKEGRDYAHLSRLLAVAVVDADGVAIFDAGEWDTWAAAHQDDAFALFEKARELSGLDVGHAEKNS